MFKFLAVVLAFAVFGQTYCGVIVNTDDLEPLVRERRQLRHDIPIGNRGSVFGSVGEGGSLAGRLGASRDLYSSNNGKLTGEAFVTRDLNLGANGAGGNLKWNSDRLQGQLEAQKFRGYNPVVTAQGSGTLWKPNKNTDLSGYVSGSKVLGVPGKPNVAGGLIFNHRF